MVFWVREIQQHQRPGFTCHNHAGHDIGCRPRPHLVGSTPWGIAARICMKSSGTDDIIVAMDSPKPMGRTLD